MHVLYGTSSGIMVTYDPNENYASPISDPIVVPDIDFSVAASTPYRGMSSTFSARFVGLFRPTLSGTATFKIAHKSVSDSYKLTMRKT